ncbi:MAG: cytochrome c-type biogenesis protein CcmH [Gemmatimonadota bacterium]
MERRRFLGLAGALALFRWQDADRLRDPVSAGRSRPVVQAADNDEVIKGIERRLHCTCGCNLDIFTCRTTDFTCGVSPQLHLEVVELHQAGNSPEEVIEAFVAKYGETVLMAPKPVGFNLAGYLVPGLVVAAASTALAVVLLRRHRLVSVTVESQAVAAGPDDADLARLEKELAEVAD